MLIRTVFAVLLESYLHPHWTLWLPRFCCFSVIRVCSRTGYIDIYSTCKVTRRNSLHWIYGMHCEQQLFALILTRLVSMEVPWTLQNSCNALFTELSVIGGSGTAWPIKVASCQCGYFLLTCRWIWNWNGLCFLVVSVCSADDRNSVSFPSLALPLFPVAPGQQRFHWYVSHPLILSSRRIDNLDPKWRTPNTSPPQRKVRPLTPVFFFFFVPSEKNHRWKKKNRTILVMRYAFLVVSTLFEWNLSGNCPFSKMFSRKRPAAFRFLGGMIITSVIS